MSQTTVPRQCDVIVVGAGPAGSAAATALAQHGRCVVVLERDHFPRYHVGESLIPHCWYPLERMGLVEKLDSSGFIVRKYSVQFVTPEGKLSTPFYFQEHSDHDSSRTWQVVRSDFDQLLVENAEEKGALVIQGATVQDFLGTDEKVDGVRVKVHGEEYEIAAPLTIDATGREALAQRIHRWRVPDRHLKKVAIWTYYQGARRDPGIDEGATTIAYIPHKGWFWYLPLSNDIVSVGVVADGEYLYRDGKDPDEIFAREAEGQPWIRDRLAPGCKMKPCQVTGDYTYRSKHISRDGLVLAGDAFSFIDPVFSSGVYLALHSGVMVADAAHEALEAGDTGAARFADYGERLCSAIEAMRRLVHAFYDEDFNFADFLRKYPKFREDVTDCLIGSLDRDFDPLFETVSRYARIPDPLPHGGPMT